MGAYVPNPKGKPLQNWVWNATRTKAAVLIAENNMPLYRIAEELKVSHQTLMNWRVTPEFRDRVTEIESELEAAVFQLPIAKRRERVKGLQDLKERLLLIVEDRETHLSQDPEAVGGRSGLVVKQTKSVGYGKNSEIVTEYGFDPAIVRELRAIDEQAAKELGQWTDRQEISGQGGGPIIISDVIVDRSSESNTTTSADDDVEDDWEDVD